MRKIVSAMEARRKFGELLEDVSRGDEVIIERNGKPMGVLISPGDYRTIAAARTSAIEILKAADAKRRALTEREAQELAISAARTARSEMAHERKRNTRAKKSA